MSKIKKINITLLLVSVTFCIICLPPYLNKQNVSHLISRINNKQLEVHERKRISSYQVAKLYCERKINVESFEEIDEKYLNENELVIRKSLLEVLANLNIVEISDKEEIFPQGDINCYHNGTLVIVDNQPVALNFMKVTVSSFEKATYYEVIYEEETKTIINLTYMFNDIESIKKDYDVEKTQTLFENKIADYYIHELELDDNEYYFDTDSAIKDYGTAAFIEFGLKKETDEK